MRTLNFILHPLHCITIISYSQASPISSTKYEAPIDPPTPPPIPPIIPPMIVPIPGQIAEPIAAPVTAPEFFLEKKNHYNLIGVL